ncbi:multicopper oxidase [Polyporus arcularius HHB13444]|uniref:laccase n=1 Tax=Polyporus arcularius HHB13444 TaxID=1314778 RepID=A0A5C3PCC6_9APHY|nr:multicopper oxidase [Polyporus arcularius HHB13444]
MARLSVLTPVVALALVASTHAAAAAIGPSADLVISNKVISPDGFARDAVVVNGVYPAPLITAKKGDRLRINVIDKLTNHTMLKTTSIHWHGFFQKGTNWADGPAFVNQCPISSGHSFLYDFHVPGQAGTFWYHSHHSTQYCDGLRGPIVVYDPNDPARHLYDVDNEATVITLSDWYHVAARLGPRFPPGSDSTLINGLGRSASTPTADLAVIKVTHGKRYRFRLVSMSCDPNYVFSIDNHDLTVIETDGINTKPLAVDSIQIFAAQRYSFVLNANQNVSNYWIRANPNFGTTGFADGINSAILRYDGAPVAEPASIDPPVSTKPLVETDLHPLASMPVPGKPVIGGVDKAINLDFNFNGTNFFINNASFTPPTVPVLLQILSGAHQAQDLLPPGSVIPLPAHKTIEITLPATTHAPGAPHPFHLHGHAFAVVRSAGSTVYNYKDPIWRDVVSTGTPAAGDNVTIRFVTDNPGPWFLHCHIDFHLDAGFAVVFAEDIPDTKIANPVPPAWSQLCPTYNALAPDDQ